jgi:hypothetical protein
MRVTPFRQMRFFPCETGGATSLSRVLVRFSLGDALPWIFSDFFSSGSQQDGWQARS